MVKFQKIFENGNIISILNFRDREFKVTMIPYEYGMKSIEKSFDYQICDTFDDIPDKLEENEIDLDMIEWGSDDEIQEIIEQLEEIE
jgi:hypothetical protein